MHLLFQLILFVAVVVPWCKSHQLYDSLFCQTSLVLILKQEFITRHYLTIIAPKVATPVSSQDFQLPSVFALPSS